MKIALVGPAPPLRGGIAQYTGSLREALETAGHRVLALSFKRLYPGLLFPGQNQFDQGAQAFPTDAESLIDSLSPLSWRVAARRLVEWSPRGVLFQWWHPFFGPCLAGVAKGLSKRSPARRLALCHNLLSHEARGFPGRPGLERLMAAPFLKRMDGFFTHSDELVRQLRSRYPGKMVVPIFHPVYDFYSRWEPSPQANPRSDAATLLFFGNVRPYKGLETLLRAVALLPEDHPWRLIVAGDFYQPLEGFRRLASDLGIDDKIEWIAGYVANQEVPALFRRADVVVLPYRAATQSGVTALAFQFDLPVIASDVGGLSEMIDHEQTGLLTPPDDPRALADAIRRYFSRGLKDEFRERIRRKRNHLSWAELVDKIVGGVRSD